MRKYVKNCSLSFITNGNTDVLSVPQCVKDEVNSLKRGRGSNIKDAHTVFKYEIFPSTNSLFSLFCSPSFLLLFPVPSNGILFFIFSSVIYKLEIFSVVVLRNLSLKFPLKFLFDVLA